MAQKTPVSVLYELCVKVGLPNPRFVDLSKNPKEFECGVEVSTLKVKGILVTNKFTRKIPFV